MLKSLFAAFLLLSNHTALAAVAVTTAVDPASPLVIDADAKINGDEIFAPWFSARYEITNKSVTKITVVALVFEVRAADGTVEESMFALEESADGAMEIDPGQSATTDMIAFGSLPQTKNHIYEIKVKVRGWTGAYEAPIERLDGNVSAFTTH